MLTIPMPTAWLQVLYATQPADATIWKVTQDPVSASILAIKCTSIDTS